MSEIRDGDIEAIRNRTALEGRPLKSRIIVNRNEHIHYSVDDNGKVESTDRINTGENSA
jgi:hypothetical protein